MALDLTIGGESTDSYVTLVEYRAYITDHYAVDLTNNDDVEDEARLRRAFQILNGKWDWIGYRVDDDQVAEWPRYVQEYGGFGYGGYGGLGGYGGFGRRYRSGGFGGFGYGRYGYGGYPDIPRIRSDEIPRAIKHAQNEIAYILQQNIDLTPVIEAGTIRRSSSSAGPVSVSTEYDQVLESPRMTVVNNLINDYHNGLASSLEGTAEAIRG